MKNTETGGKIMQKAGRIAIIAVIVIVIGVIIIFGSSTKQSTADQVWDEQTTLGNLEAKNHYILYTDLMCPYCAVLGQTIIHDQDKFNQWLSDNDVLWEVRITDYLYEGSGIEESRPAAESIYCARNEGKFWDYYSAALEQLYQDYQSKGIAISKTAPQIKDLPDDYWQKIGESVGLGEDFKTCLDTHATAEDVENATAKAAKVASGMPSIFYNGEEGVIDGTRGWDVVKSYLNTGLK